MVYLYSTERDIFMSERFAFPVPIIYPPMLLNENGLRSRCSEWLGQVLDNPETVIRCPAEETSIFSTGFRPVLEPTQPPIQRVKEVLAGSSSDRGLNEWNYTFIFHTPSWKCALASTSVPYTSLIRRCNHWPISGQDSIPIKNHFCTKRLNIAKRRFCISALAAKISVERERERAIDGPQWLAAGSCGSRRNGKTSFVGRCNARQCYRKSVSGSKRGINALLAIWNCNTNPSTNYFPIRTWSFVE